MFVLARAFACALPARPARLRRSAVLGRSGGAALRAAFVGGSASRCHGAPSAPHGHISGCYVVNCLSSNIFGPSVVPSVLDRILCDTEGRRMSLPSMTNICLFIYKTQKSIFKNFINLDS